MTRRLSIAVLLLAGCSGTKDADTSRQPTSTDSPTAGTLSGTTTTVSTTPNVALTTSGVISCADPSARDNGWWDRTELPIAPIDRSLLRGGGMVLDDLSGDGRPDLLVVSDGASQLWVQQDNGTWADESATRLPATLDWDLGSGASGADFDADGDVDLMVTFDGADNHFLVNTDGVFSDQTLQVGLPSQIRRSMASSWADWDLDGDLDLAVANYHRSQPNRFFENQANGTFTEVSLLPPEMDDGLSFQLTWHDLGGDGYPELFVANDHPGGGADTALFANQGGSLVQDLDAGYHPDWDGMGIVIADFTGDGKADVAETSWRNVSLLTHSPAPGTTQDLVFIDSTSAMGLRADRIPLQQRFSWGIDAGDLDHDGDLDLVATWGHWEAGDETNQILAQPDSIWLFDGSQFIEQPPHDYGTGRAELLVDLNGDGWLDLVKRVLKEPTVIDTARCGVGHWLTVGVQDHPDSMNLRGIGVTVRVEAAGDSWIRWIDSGSRSMYSSAPPRVHVGLGDHEIIDTVEVIWPDGRRATAHDVAANQHLTLEMLEPPAFP